MITMKALAKINLTLEVLRKRPDGFHEIRSVLQTIDLHDTLYIEESRGVSYQCDMEGWSAEKSLVSKVVALLREETGYKGGVGIKIEKRIPLLSGLGGDSSDAAALLRGLNDLWNLDLSEEKLAELAVKLGSDVPFFLRRGTALATGRGEIISPLTLPEKLWLVLVVPDVPVEAGKTAKMYAALNSPHYTDGAITETLVASLKKGKAFTPLLLFNTFENIAFEYFEGLAVYKEHLIKLGAPHVHVAGSGPTLFSVLGNKSKAQDLYKLYQDQGFKAILAGTL